MSQIDDEVAGPHGLGRRSLIKRGAAAGAIGLTAPITFDSFFSPAAACSGEDLSVATGLTVGAQPVQQSTANWRAGTNGTIYNGTVTTANQRYYATVANAAATTNTLTTIPAGTLVVVAFDVEGATGVFSVGLFEPGLSPVTVNPSLVFTERRRVTGGGVTLSVWSGTTTAPIPANRYVRVDTGSAAADAFAGQVTLISGGTAVVAQTTTTARFGTGTTTAPIGFPASPNAKSGELFIVGFGISHNPGNGNNITIGTTATTPTAQAIFRSDYVNRAGSNELAMGTRYFDVAQAGVTATFTEGNSNNANGSSWRVVALEISC